MSGGHFDYAYWRADQFADQLDEELVKETEWTPEVLQKLQRIVQLTRITAACMKEAEWLYSGDTGEDTFLERVHKIEADSGLKVQSILDGSHD
jgi:hypothetical protein